LNGRKDDQGPVAPLRLGVVQFMENPMGGKSCRDHFNPIRFEAVLLLVPLFAIARKKYLIIKTNLYQ
jgi:hypothetical protein